MDTLGGDGVVSADNAVVPCEKCQHGTHQPILTCLCDCHPPRPESENARLLREMVNRGR